MNIKVNKQSRIPLYVQIKNQIRDNILSGQMPEGFRLPSERKLAEMLKVDRSTVFKAYNDLKSDSLIESDRRRWTKVAGGKSLILSMPKEEVSNSPWETNFSEYSNTIDNDTYSKAIDITYQSDIISFAGGIPAKDPKLIQSIVEIQSELFKNLENSEFPYCSYEGNVSLRESLLNHMKKSGIYSELKEIMILTGSQQGIHFVAKSFIIPGDIVVVEEPTYIGAIQCFRSAGAKIIGLPGDKDGMRIELLEEVLKRNKVKFIYITPTFQNPTGTVMTIERRYQLLSLAYKYKTPILEDDPYGELRYEGAEIPSLKALDPYGYVLYLSTLTRTLFLELRIGWIVAPAEIIKKFTSIKSTVELHSNIQMQMVADAFIKRNFYDKHLKSICKEYKSRRDKMIKSLSENKIEGMEWNIPEGGVYIWCKLPDKINQSKLMLKAAEFQVAFMPGTVFYTEKNSAENYMRLNFTFPTIDEIDVGVKRLTTAIKKCL
jgi:DNA-binding transcriptional MocR family regulator